MSSSYHSAESALTRILKYASRSEAAAMQATISRLQSAADRGPDLQALDALGTALLAANRASEAVEHLFQAATLAPEDAGILYRLGSAQLGSRKFGEAERSLTRALSLLAVQDESGPHQPLEPRIRTKLGISLLELKRDRDAASVLSTVVESRSMADPSTLADAHHHLAIALDRLGYEQSPLSHLEEALELCPRRIRTRLRLGQLCVHRGDLDRARSCFEHILGQRPHHVGARTGLAAVLHRMGETDRALLVIEPVMDQALQHEDLSGLQANTAVVYARLLGTQNRQDEAIRLLDRWLSVPRERLRESRVQAARAELLDRTGDPELAIQAMSRSHELRGVSYDPAEHERRIGGIMASYTISNIASRSLPAPTAPANLPVFLVGMPRSGTSLLEQALACHPDIQGAGELPHLSRIATRIGQLHPTGRNDPGALLELSPAILHQLAREHREELTELADGSPIVIDKTPLNFLYLGMVAVLHPDARVLHCTRDPIDTCLSCYLQTFPASLSFATSLEGLGHYHSQYRRLCHHWCQHLPLPLHTVAYEDMVDDLESTLRGVLDFLELDWHPGCMDYHESGRVVHTASFDQVRQPIYRRSVGRALSYAHLLGPLISSLWNFADKSTNP